jgi:hypothetical protein
MILEKKTRETVCVTKPRRIKRGCGIFLMPSMRFELATANAGLVGLGVEERKERMRFSVTKMGKDEGDDSESESVQSVR